MDPCGHDDQKENRESMCEDSCQEPFKSIQSERPGSITERSDRAGTARGELCKIRLKEKGQGHRPCPVIRGLQICGDGFFCLSGN